MQTYFSSFAQARSDVYSCSPKRSFVAYVNMSFLSSRELLKGQPSAVSNHDQLSLVKRKPTFWFPTWSDTNQAVQLQMMARGLKFRKKEEEGLHYPCRENKGADQLICFFVFAYAKCWFSHDAAQLLKEIISVKFECKIVNGRQTCV